MNNHRMWAIAVSPCNLNDVISLLTKVFRSKDIITALHTFLCNEEYYVQVFRYGECISKLCRASGSAFS
jgi:hypothetical protein